MGASGTVQCHTSPTMNLTYSVDDSGNYSVSVDKPNESKFAFSWELKVNGTTVISKSVANGNNAKWNSGTKTGNCGTSFTVTATCNSSDGCSIAGETGNGPHNYTVVNTINLHTHSAPFGGSVHLYDCLKSNSSVSSSTSQIRFGYDEPENWGCSDASGWNYSYGNDNWSGIIAASADASHTEAVSPGASLSIRIRLYNAHSKDANYAQYYREIGPALFRARYATPELSITNGNPLNNDSTNVSNSTTSITINAKNSSISNCGTVTYEYSISSGSYNESYSTTNESHKFTGLTAGTKYTVSVSATNEDGDSDSKSTTIRTRYAKPTVTLSNANVRSGTNNAAVSDSRNSIKIKATVSGSNIGSSFTYYFKKSTDSEASWINNGNTDTYTFTELNPGTSYTLQVLVDTADGYSSDTRSDLKSITIRTCYAKSNFTNNITVDDIGLEHVRFTPLFQYNKKADIVKSATYSITGVSGDGCSGTAITVQSNQTKQTTSAFCLTASSKYTITVSVTTTDTYDRITYTHSTQFTTDAKSSFSKTLGNLGFAMPSDVFGTYTIKNPSGNNVRCTLYVKNIDSSSYTSICTRDLSTGWDKQQNLVLTDSECDKIYKILANTTNVMNYLWRVGTYSNRYDNYTKYYTDCTGTLTLNGKMKTLHIGSGNHRAAVFIGVKSGNATAVKRAVIWYGDANGKPHRCI